MGQCGWVPFWLNQSAKLEMLVMEIIVHVSKVAIT